MNKENFIKWLMEEKNMSIRSAKDIISRRGRICRMLDTNELNIHTMERLTACDGYKESSMFIKSQLKRTVTLALEYENYLGEK